jgi:hypothetical protein
MFLNYFTTFDVICTLTFILNSRMFFGGYEDDDNDDIHETSSQKDESEEDLEDVAAELDLGEPPDELKEFARQNLGESLDTRPNLVQELRDMIYG